MMLLDTSGLLSALFPDQQGHESSAEALRRSDPPLILSPFVLAEIDYLIEKMSGVDVELQFLEEVSRGAYQVAPFDRRDIEAARFIIAKYRDLGIGLADASIMVLADRYQTRQLLTLDERHFRVLKMESGDAFRILPADLDV
ncbi:MAG TPA: PIN domain-containing protein [Acidobacteriota bacterium]|nr:PIN domain-containing protein [Acidobacteriota bacterium]